MHSFHFLTNFNNNGVEFHDWKATSHQLASALDVDEKALRRVLNALVAIGILTMQRGDYYALTEVAALHLVYSV
jgi:DNA-binding IscR family transcriptional regulator